MDYIAERGKCIDASEIRRIWQLAATMTDPVDFSIGEPDFPAPERVKAAAIEAIRQDKNTYTLTTGIEPLRTAVAGRIADQLGWDNPGVLVTSGLSGALLLALMATVNPGDEVLMADPYFVSYKHLVSLHGGTCVFIDTYPDFQLSAEQVAAHITPKTKMLLLNSPANPTGTVYTAENLRAVAEVAREHELLVISDEIYELFSYDTPAVSIAEFYENTIVMRGYSKSLGVPGWRLGYIAVPEHLGGLLDQIATLQQYTFVCAPHPFQIAALEAFNTDMSSLIDAYRTKRNLVYEGLKDSFGLLQPQGAFYAFVPAPGGDATAFVEKAIKNDVLIIPGSVFSQENTHFRLSYATSDEDIAKGVERLNALAAG